MTVLPPHVSEIATRLAPGLGFAIDVTEAITGTYALGRNEGKHMSTLDRGVAVVGVLTMGYGSKARMGLEGAEVVAKGMSAIERTETLKFLNAADNIGVKTKAGAKTFASMYHAIDNVPEVYNGLRIIREGADSSKIAVIGRGMGEVDGVGVHAFSKHMKSNGILVETVGMELSKTALIDFNKAIKAYEILTNNNKAILPASEVVKTALYKENKEWVDKLIREGYTVLDIGNNLGNPIFSAFYAMEKFRLGGGLP